jgi:hypothetical protein
MDENTAVIVIGNLVTWIAKNVKVSNNIRHVFEKHNLLLSRLD